MRYRIVLDQVMETWYVTLISWEADGMTIQRHTEHLSFEVSNENLEDFYILMVNLAAAYSESHN